MSQKNYIKTSTIPEYSDIPSNQVFNFSGFLFYVDGWSWDNVEGESNLDYPGILDEVSSVSVSNPYEAIRSVDLNRPTSTTNPDAWRPNVEFYWIAAACRRYQIYSSWRERYRENITPRFLDSYTDNAPGKSPLADGNLTWTVWSGDIQSFTNSPNGGLSVGSYIFAKNLDIQQYTPVSIENSSKDIKFDKGYGEIKSKNYITNYYNPIEVYSFDLFSLKDGWYGVVTLDSTPYVIEPLVGITFDTFVKIESNKITQFHANYLQAGKSEYGSKKRTFISR
jgi:hypothetical protein